MASTILRFRNKNIYQIIDQRAYRFLKGKNLKLKANIESQIELYLSYLKKLRGKCDELNIPFENADRIFYMLDKDLNRRSTEQRQRFNPVYQFQSSKPKVNDLLIFGATKLNSYGHVAIISKVTEDEIEIIQQNAGAYSSSREKFPLKNQENKWQVMDSQVVGWLRKK